VKKVLSNSAPAVKYLAKYRFFMTKILLNYCF